MLVTPGDKRIERRRRPRRADVAMAVCDYEFRNEEVARARHARCHVVVDYVARAPTDRKSCAFSIFR